MTAQEQVARLEALLARVQSRRDAPRPAGAALAKDHVPDDVVVTVPPAPSTPIPTSAVVETPHEPSVSVSASVEMEVDVEVAEGTAEIDLDGIEADELVADSLAAESLSSSVADLEATAERPEAAEAADVPASSRRAIQLEPQLANLAFDDTAEVTASRSAPPESGRQVALPDDDFERSGVRPLADAEQASAPAVQSPERPASVPPAPTAPPPPYVAAMVPAERAAAAAPVVAAPPVPRVAEVTRPAAVLAPAAVFRGTAPEWKPQNFGELLEATLGL